MSSSAAVAPLDDHDQQGCTPTTLQAVDLGYELGGKRILANVNATFEPRKLTALMGPSGAGKTTMLNTLAHRASGSRTGEILVNGYPKSLQKMRSLLSFMPQDDILYYAAMMRVPSRADDAPRERRLHAKKIARADALMRTLGMAHVADNVLSEVSGGQRKRASAAVEFMSDRPLLFMDEPTSGLDSATAKALVDRLSRAAHDESRTVICTIHQPSWELINKFDKVVLLAGRGGNLGGTVVFDAPPAHIPAYFESGGSPVPTGENPADHIMYVLNDEGGEKWTDVWSTSEQRAVATQQATEERARLEAKLDLESDDADDYPISYCEQYRVLFIRTLHIWVADPQQGQLVFKMIALVNVMMALLLAGIPDNLSKGNGLFFYIAAQFNLSMIPLVIIMPEERAVILREYRNGVFSATAYWLARFTLCVGNVIVMATFQTLFFYPVIGLPLTPFPSKLLRWWCLQFLYLGCVMMLGLTAGIFSQSALGGIKAVIAIQLPWMSTAGVLPPLAYVRPTVFFLRYPNLFTWATKLELTIAFTSAGGKADETLREGLGVHPGNADSCFQALAFCFIIIFFAGLFAVHRTLNRPDLTAGGLRSFAKTPAAAAAAAAQSVAASDNSYKPLAAGIDDEKGSLIVTSNPLVGALASSVGYGATDVEAPAVVRSVPIEVRSVTYRHKRAPEKIAINNVSVRFSPGSVTILMGPSGAGKTTLLKLLCGRLPAGTFTAVDGRSQPLLEGEVLVDHRTTDFSAFKKIGTLTPQDEVLTPELTVRQTLLYAAELRSPRSWSYAQKVARVNAVLVKLGLDVKAENVVGTYLKVGISGGQKKRLSIGMDLLAELPIMLVDEPTTGLDASSALNVVQTLITLASDQYRTIICTIHQPPWSMVIQFDQLVLLALGKLVFDGPPVRLPDFLRAGGSPVPSNENPADYAMVVLVADSNEKWHKLHDKRASAASAVAAEKDTEKTIGSDDEISSLLANFDSYMVSEFTQYTVLLRRFSYIFITDPEQFEAVFFPSLIVGIVVGLSFHNFGVNVYLAASILMGCVSHGMLSLNATMLNIPSERPLILREFRNGTYSVRAYWFARATVSSCVAVFLSFPLTTIWYSLVGLPLASGAILHTWLASTLNAAVFSLMGCVIGLVCKTPLASAQVADPIGNCMLVFSGAIIAKRFIKSYLMPIFYGLPINWSFSIILGACLEHKGEDGDDVLSYYSVHPGDRRFGYFVLFGMYVAWNFIGYHLASYMINGQDES
ncbi:hypothetical protein CTAYLR_001871 [Chrysophaeum taylorii]|uniref:ABC transporter domain-containing protein n=1 Tax=Chrysophaeum taylorii TaxID=2483200 RepID=A0AAD7U891_9STRA|nr:hypothetical protein CTAYLR_001871 [Chrysophaeum taylorii]